MPPNAGPIDEAVLALIHRGWEHLRVQSPLAAWAAWKQALVLRPNDRAATEALERLAMSPVLPGVARRAYQFRSPRGEGRRSRWDAALRGRDMADLDQAVEAFAALADRDAGDLDARFNAALGQAWSGRNRAAIHDLDRFVALAARDEFEAAANAWNLAELLRHGAGAEAVADEVSYHVEVREHGDEPDLAAVVPPERLWRVPLTLDAATRPGGALEFRAFEWHDRPMPGAPADGAELRPDALPRLVASVVATGTGMRFSLPTLDCFTQEAGTEADLPVRRQLLPELAARGWEWDQNRTVRPLNLLDADVWVFRLPTGLEDEPRTSLARAAIADYYENTWIHLGRHGLGDHSADEPSFVAPQQAGLQAAAGDATARAKLEGIIRFREELARRPATQALYASYPFDRLRRRLGLERLDPGTVDDGDVTCMSARELAALDPATLDPAERASAARSAAGLRRPDLIARFASTNPELPS